MLTGNALFAFGGAGFWEGVVTWYQSSLLREILLYFRERYFSLELIAYENFSITPAKAALIRQLILAFAVGMIAASVFAAFQRLHLGRMIRRLGKEGSFSPQNAKTLMELDLFRNSLLRHELSYGYNLRKMVRCVEEEAYSTAPETGKKRKKYRIDFTKDHFYIPEELRYRAQVRYDRKGFGWPLVLGTALFMLLLVAVVFWLLPDILRLADNLITAMSPE